MTISEEKQKDVLGAHYAGNRRCAFMVWAPLSNSVALKITAPAERLIPMTPVDRGYWRTEAGEVFPGMRYLYRLDEEKERPDPASRFQPEGVHGSSQIIDHTAFPWDDSSWKGPALEDYIVFELHVGTFTREGTFARHALLLLPRAGLPQIPPKDGETSAVWRPRRCRPMGSTTPFRSPSRRSA